ncbi:pilus assembly protein PilP [Thermodesulfovibrio sp. 3462-1]|jgi:type IV pilus assembly protein PilP|uniref:Pilus assembly protein PilP n=1 Tax=Thermodesulfovibrio obliviosus TaxID=3118332 RepID=A0AAU8H0C6_9BACT
MMERKRILIITGALVLLAVLLIGFLLLNKEEKSQQIIIKTPKRQPVQINQPNIVFPTYNYDAQQLRDPFAPLIVKREARKKGASPLETYEIEELKLTGIAKDKKGALALLQAPDGRFYIVRENDRIGYTGGKVIKILMDSIEIRENNKVKYLKLKTEE